MAETEGLTLGWEDRHTVRLPGLILRPERVADGAAVLETMDDEVVAALRWDPRMIEALRDGPRPPLTPKRKPAWPPLPADRCPTEFVVCEEDDVPIGVLRLTLGPNGTASMGGWLGGTGRHRGIGTRAFPVMVRYLQVHLGVEMVKIQTLADNSAAVRLVERTGARLVGSSMARYPDGTLNKTVWYSIERSHLDGQPPYWPPCR